MGRIDETGPRRRLWDRDDLSFLQKALAALAYCRIRLSWAREAMVALQG